MKYFPYALLGISALLFPYCVQRVFLATPIEAEMGTAQKIFYFHVPLAWICMLFAVICGVAAGIQLRKRSARAEALAVAAGEMCVLAGVGVLITGPIWGDATWGTPWTGDARQVSTALLWMVFVAYLLVRRFGPSNSDRLAAALAIFGAFDVPIIYYAVKIWKTTHPKTGVVGSLPQEMWNTLWICLVPLMMTCVALVWIRARQERMAMALDEAWIATETEVEPAPAPA
ncbi:cytochrome c biogenesis protein CcsA [Pseudenhygromyxa sp. WMMC2535]|uniref:cytochrome c biogenesis protein CcsA n=1 Tax=Pseudenhygromyxa sp. WMMC2535 TaxID=2712867 RepID=UPI001556E1CC|nr:cytochrome c biogenesis protein CcsA [Pseudenhygromyxa sp. WMMC2535]NVB36508.1 cytochrome c biogenesis protein CcsA [Pseudenhygromyxa sp. WMMC2535]